MAKIIIDEKITDVTPEIIAELFCDLDSGQQAAFYNEVALIGGRWIGMQLQSITEENGLTLAGRRVMDQIGQYSHWGLSCNLTEETMREE